jgi:predicted PurR-regulated permease PerM
MLLHPFVCKLTRWKLNRVVAIAVCIILAISVIGILLYFLSTQVGSFLDDIPALKERLREVSMSAKQWVQEKFNIGIREQNKYLNETTAKMNEGQGIVQQTFITLTELISYIIFLPVYAFLILYHKDTIKQFLVAMFKRSEEDKIAEVLDESQHISQQYVMGVLIELGIVFILNSAGFLLIGIKYPIFLALVAALLNIVPYIGMIIANIFCVLVTLVSSDPSINLLWVFAVLAGVQVIDNNILMPYIVGSKIRINAMAIILGVLVGGALCGFPGMFLALPGLAIMKVVFARVDNLKPWAILIGDEVAENPEYKNPLRRAFSRAGRKNNKKEPA